MNRRDNNNLLESTNRGNVNMNKEIKEKVAGNRDFINMNKEIIARKLKIFSVDKEIKEIFPGNPPTNLENIDIDKEVKEKVAGSSPTNRGILNMIKK